MIDFESWWDENWEEVCKYLLAVFFEAGSPYALAMGSSQKRVPLLDRLSKDWIIYDSKEA